MSRRLLGLLWGLVTLVGMREADAQQIPYHHGALLENVEVMAVQWGPSVEGSTSSVITPFLEALSGGSYMDLLREYSIEGRTIGGGNFAGAYTRYSTNDPANLSLGSPQDLDSNIVEDEIARQISWGNLPHPNNNTLYVIYFPKYITVSDRIAALGITVSRTPVPPNPQPDGRCDGACAFHKAVWMGYPLRYA